MSESQGSGSDAERAVFRRVLCGVDGSPEGLEAVLQADALQGERGELTAISALDLAVTVHAGWSAMAAASGLRADTELALSAAQTAVPGATCRLVEGRPDQALLAETRRTGATLLAVGTHGFARPIGIALGSVTTVALHEAPCSVLVARPRPSGDALPRSIVVGIDGSDESATAWAVAKGLADRLQIGAQPVAARHGKDFDLAAVDLITEGAVMEDGNPVDTLLNAAKSADLLVVGSRGLHGVRALRSVSERVAHRAPCSVLVVRAPTDT